MSAGAASRSAPSKLPSFGFMAVVLVHLSLVLFLIWGFAQPPLDRVWELSQGLKIGKFGTLSPTDLELLRTTLARHPRLGDSLTRDEIGILSANSRGWLETLDATLLVRADAVAPCSMRVTTRLESSAFPLELTVSGAGWRRQLVVSDAGGAEIVFPGTGRAADVVELRFTGKVPTPNGVHLGFRCGERAARR